MTAPNDEAMLAQGQSLITSIVKLAQTCPAGGDARWDAMLRKLGVKPLAADERQRHVVEGPGQSKGALLLELRWALEAGTNELASYMDDGHRLRAAVAQAVRDYVKHVKPTITTSSIFANALATTGNKLSGQADASAETCTCCGAPLADRSASSCRYCGETLGAAS